MNMTGEQFAIWLTGVAGGIFASWFLRWILRGPTISAVGADAMAELRQRLDDGGASSIVMRRDLLAALVSDASRD